MFPSVWGGSWLVGHGYGDDVAIGSRCWCRLCRHLAIDRIGLFGTGPGAGHRIGSDRVPPNIRMRRIGIERVCDRLGVRSGHEARSNGGSGSRALVQADVIGGSIGALDGNGAGRLHRSVYYAGCAKVQVACRVDLASALIVIWTLNCVVAVWERAGFEMSVEIANRPRQVARRF